MTAGRFPEIIHALGFSSWTHDAVRDFLNGSQVEFLKDPKQVPAGSSVALWSSMPAVDLPDDISIIRVADGFLRSVGLGVLLKRPLSLAFDPVGIYYDSRTPSLLEQMLQAGDFEPALVERAKRLRERIVAGRITKYNVRGFEWRRPKTGRAVVLVPGQVEDDASIRCGAPGARTNIELVKAARLQRPDAYLIYKPHPDVVAGLRDRGRREEEASAFCDEIVTHGAMGQILDQIDEVQTLTSLAGFEALLRGKSVTCHGQPFYAGWGLTTDIIPPPRRTRRLKLDELVAAALILYPTYVSPDTRKFISPEEAVDILLASRRLETSRQVLTDKAWQTILRIERVLLKAAAAVRGR